MPLRLIYTAKFLASSYDKKPLVEITEMIIVQISGRSMKRCGAFMQSAK